VKKNSGNVTIVDVASEAGVSYTTVSRVLNNKENVKPKTRERVLTAMTRLGYVVDQRARSLAGGRSQLIGLLVHDLGTSYIGEIMRGIDAELAPATWPRSPEAWQMGCCLSYPAIQGPIWRRCASIVSPTF